MRLKILYEGQPYTDALKLTERFGADFDNESVTVDYRSLYEHLPQSRPAYVAGVSEMSEFIAMITYVSEDDRTVA